jgi:hypothetical protein
MALNAFAYILIVFGTVFPVFSVIAAIAFMWYFSSPEDYKRAWLPRLVVIISFSLAFLSVFLLPLDIANARLDAGLTFALGIIWQVFYGVVCLFVIVVIPFTIFVRYQLLQKFNILISIMKRKIPIMESCINSNGRVYALP